MHCREPEGAEDSEARVQQLNRAFFEKRRLARGFWNFTLVISNVKAEGLIGADGMGEPKARSEQDD